MTRTGEGPQPSYWLESGGGRIHVGPASVLVGRSPDCDIVLTGEGASRHHALFRATDEGVEVVPFGRQPVSVNGVGCITPTALTAGDRVQCADLTLCIVRTESPPGPEARALWGLERSPGALFRITHSPFRVGGGDDDHLLLPGWPAATLALHPVGHTLCLEALCAGVSVGAPLEVGALVSLRSGSRIGFGAQALRAIALPREPASVTHDLGEPPVTDRIELRFLPRGGRLTVWHGSVAQSVYLPDRRCDLVATLLHPPAPFQPGDLIPDNRLSERVWPTLSQGRVELNTLVFRVRKDLLKAGIDGAALLERAAGGVRFCLSPGATVSVS